MDTVLSRYRDLRDWRRWYRTTGRRMFEHRWDDLEAENRDRLREIVRIRWAARQAARTERC